MRGSPGIVPHVITAGLGVGVHVRELVTQPFDNLSRHEKVASVRRDEAMTHESQSRGWETS